MPKPCCFVFAAAIACLTQAFAQTSAGVNGIILDSSGAAMPDTQVTITSQGLSPLISLRDMGVEEVRRQKPEWRQRTHRGVG